jgi:hypothetical protein
MGNKVTGEGPKVIEVTLPAEKIIDALSSQINELLKQWVSPGAVTILSALPYSQPVTSSLPLNIKETIQELDDYSVRNFPLNKITFSEIKKFKGLENEVILLVDLPSPTQLNQTDNKTLHYVGMSRARGLLCLFWEK